MTTAVLKDIAPINNSLIVDFYIDRSKNTKEIDIFNTYIRSTLETTMLENATLNIEHVNSKNNLGLQVVDIFCYGIARKYEHNDDYWYKNFEEKIKKEIIYRI